MKNGQIFVAIWYSFRRIFVATVVASAVAIPTGLLVYNVSIARDVLKPIIDIMRYLPVTAFYPLLIMWFGIDDKMKEAFLFIAVFVNVHRCCSVGCPVLCVQYSENIK